jgi:hypothetical protein
MSRQHVRVCMYVYVRIYVCTRTYVCVYMYICMYVCMHVCILNVFLACPTMLTGEYTRRSCMNPSQGMYWGTN